MIFMKADWRQNMLLAFKLSYYRTRVELYLYVQSYGHAALTVQKMKSNCPLRMRSRMLQCLREVRELVRSVE